MGITGATAFSFSAHVNFYFHDQLLSGCSDVKWHTGYWVRYAVMGNKGNGDHAQAL